MENTLFYSKVADALNKENTRICNFTDYLDKNPLEKKEKIAEYKCAKYRYASITLIHSTLHNNNLYRKLRNLKDSHYLLLPFDEIFKCYPEYVSLYDSAPEDEKPDYSLYYAISAFTDRNIEELKDKLNGATDWEVVELNERISGLEFAKVCLDEAWQERK